MSDIEGLKISELDLYPGGLPQASRDGAEFPVTAAASNFKIRVAGIMSAINDRLNAALSGKADLEDLEALAGWSPGRTYRFRATSYPPRTPCTMTAHCRRRLPGKPPPMLP